MTGKVRSVLIILSVVSGSLAAVGFGRATVHDSHPNQCYNAKSESYYSPGESWPMDGCGKITCEQHSSSSQLMISFESCGVAMVQPPCYLVEDNTKSYPDCCSQVVCPETNDDDEGMYGVSSEEFWDDFERNGTAYPSSVENDLAGTAVHFSLGGRKDINMDRSERNDLQSLEAEEEKQDASLEIPQPRLLPPTFKYAVFNDIDNDHEQRLNDVDEQGDYQLV